MTTADSAALRLTLQRRNVALCRDLRTLEGALRAATIPPLLEAYRNQLEAICRNYAGITDRNLLLLSLDEDSILVDILSGTKQANQIVRLLSGRLATPVLRSTPDDSLCLKIIAWMHSVHPMTSALPVAFGDGDVAVWTFLLIVAPIYSFPCLEQRGILFQALHLHEFGHVLHTLHKREIDDLVKEVQRMVEDTLQLLSQRDDRHSEAQAARQKAVVNTWYSWAVELFCDAVGLTMGGPAYLRAFSCYCGNMSRTDFYRNDKDLQYIPHPVTWLRIHLLARRAAKLGLAEVGREVEEEWAVLANTMGVTEDYHGYYDESMEDDLYRIVGDMLTEAAPRQFLSQEVVPTHDTAATDTPIHLMNRAWQIHQNDPLQYSDWEAKALSVYLGGDALD